MLLTVVVLIQKPKGSGLSSSLGGSGSQFFGVQKTTDYLEKATWILIIALIVFSVAFTYEVKPDVAAATETGSGLQEQTGTAPTPEATAPEGTNNTGAGTDENLLEDIAGEEEEQQ